MKRRSDSTVGDLSSCCDKSTDLIDSYASLKSSDVWDNDIPPTPSEPTSSTLIDLLKMHSNALRRPIPSTNTSPSGFSVVEADEGKPAFCPACQHVVILLPQKRQKNRIGESNCYQQTAYGVYNAKRKRLDLLEEGDQPNCSQRKYKDSRTATRGHFNPTYAPCCRNSGDLETSIYAEVCNDDVIDGPNQRMDTEFRQKRTAVRRLTQRLSRNDSSEFDLQSGMDTSFFGGFNVDLPDQPWMTSTLRSRIPTSNSPFDVETVYDDVASDCESEVEYYIMKTADADSNELCFNEVLDSQLWSNNNKFLTDDKRVRREYFLCEE